MSEKVFSCSLFSVETLQDAKLILATGKAKVAYLDDLSPSRDSLLHKVVSCSFDPQLILLYVAHGCDPWYSSAYGTTLLESLVERHKYINQENIAQYIENLVKVGAPADPKIKNHHYYTGYNAISLIERIKKDSSDVKKVEVLEITLQQALNKRRTLVKTCVDERIDDKDLTSKIILDYYEPTWDELKAVVPKKETTTVQL